MTAHLDCVPSVMARSSGPYLDIYVPGLPMTTMGTLIGGSDGGTEDTESERGSKREKKKGRERERESAACTVSTVVLQYVDVVVLRDCDLRLYEHTRIHPQRHSSTHGINIATHTDTQIQS